MKNKKEMSGFLFKNKKEMGGFLFKNKKASASATLTWMVATFIILFILILFLIAVSLLDFRKGGISSEIGTKAKIDFVLVENFLGFLNEPIVFEGQQMQVKNLIASEDKENLEEFRKLAEDFMEKNVKPKQGSIKGLELEYSRAWIRIYGINEEIGQYRSGKYKSYGVWRGPSKSSSFSETPCNPKTKEGWYYDIVKTYDNPVIEFFIPENKKIVMCLEYK